MSPQGNNEAGAAEDTRVPHGQAFHSWGRIEAQWQRIQRLKQRMLAHFQKPCYGGARNLSYETYWQKRGGQSGIQPRHPIMAGLIEAPASVLDYGCGDGAFLQYLTKNKNVTAEGVDISTVAVGLARARGVTAQFADLVLIQEWAKSQGRSWDYVTCAEVIEHVANAEEHLKALFSLCRKMLIVSFPNIAFWPHRMRLAFAGRCPVQWVQHPAEHLRFWSLSDFREWVFFVLGDAVADIRFMPSNGLSYCNLYRRWPNLFANQIVVSIRKHECSEP